MALINCPECGKYISDKAPSCPKCGLPLKPKEEQLGARIAYLDTKNMSDIDKELIELIKERKVLLAIKRYKDLTGCDLSIAKEHVDRLLVQSGINKTNNGGCLTVIIIAVISSILLAII